MQKAARRCSKECCRAAFCIYGFFTLRQNHVEKIYLDFARLWSQGIREWDTIEPFPEKKRKTKIKMKTRYKTREHRVAVWRKTL